MPYHQSCVDDFDNLVALQTGLLANHLERGGIDTGVNMVRTVTHLSLIVVIVGLLDECCLNAFGNVASRVMAHENEPRLAVPSCHGRR